MTGLIVKSSAKEAIKANNISLDIYHALNEVEELLEDGLQRTEARERQTV